MPPELSLITWKNNLILLSLGFHGGCHMAVCSKTRNQVAATAFSESLQTLMMLTGLEKKRPVPLTEVNMCNWTLAVFHITDVRKITG